jgi:hypothetical protein
MLKTISSVVNAIGALNYKGTWNASTNTPTLTSGVGTKGDYYQVSVAGSTSLDGLSNWGIGDVAAFNGTTWQRIEGGADLNGVNLSVSGTSTLGDNATFSTAGKGVNFSANANAPGMTSELLNWYEEGTFTAELRGSVTQATIPVTTTAYYTRVGRQVTIEVYFFDVDTTGASGDMQITGLPFTPAGTSITRRWAGSVQQYGLAIPGLFNSSDVFGGSTTMQFQSFTNNGAWSNVQITAGANKFLNATITYFV